MKYFVLASSRTWRFMQIRQRIFNFCIGMKIMHFILDKMQKLLTYYTSFYHFIIRYLTSKTVRFFGQPCMLTWMFSLAILVF